jgi:hypothetical protein
MAPFIDDNPLPQGKSSCSRLLKGDFDVDSLIDELTIEEKAALLAGSPLALVS